MKKSIVGDLINFRGLVYSPINENGVIFIFGKIIEDLNIYIEEIKPGFPDCIGRRFTGKGWEKVNIEFEYKSSNFKNHGHNPKECDIIVCWEHDWTESPIEIIELKEIIKDLPDNPISRPDNTTEQKYTLEEHLKNTSSKVKNFFKKYDEGIKRISDEVWSKITSGGLTYYSPERVFIYLDFQKQAIKLTLFTASKNIKGVEKSTWSVGGIKWGRIYIREMADIETAIKISTRSYRLIKEAVKKNEPTGWWADWEDEEQEIE